MNYDKKLLNRIYKMYVTEKFGYNNFCLECKKQAIAEDKKLIHGPVPIFHIGKDYSANLKRIVFIGLVAYGWNDITTDQDKTWGKIFVKDSAAVNKTQKDIETRFYELFFREHNEVTFLSYIKAACESIFGSAQKGFDNIAVTNFVHCNTGSVNDNLSQAVRNNCADANLNGFIHKEMEILNPTHIVVLTKDWKYTRFTGDFHSEPKYIEVIHPSAPGRVKAEFAREICQFYFEPDDKGK